MDKTEVKKPEEKMVHMTPDELQKLIDSEKKKAVREAKKSERKVVEKQSKMRIADFMGNSGLTDEDFCKQLMAWNVQPEWARCLREGHKKLTRQAIFKMMRENYVRPRKTR